MSESPSPVPTLPRSPARRAVDWIVSIPFFAMHAGNNHHYYQSSARQGFYWWEVDLSYYVLKLWQAFGLVWDVWAPPPSVLTH